MTTTYDAAPLRPEDIPPIDRRAIAAWLLYWAAFAAVDTYAHRNGRTTLSKAGRWLFKTHTKTGRACFTLAYATGAYALHRHVVNGGQR